MKSEKTLTTLNNYSRVSQLATAAFQLFFICAAFRKKCENIQITVGAKKIFVISRCRENKQPVSLFSRVLLRGEPQTDDFNSNIVVRDAGTYRRTIRQEMTTRDTRERRERIMRLRITRHGKTGLKICSFVVRFGVERKREKGSKARSLFKFLVESPRQKTKHVNKSVNLM